MRTADEEARAPRRRRVRAESEEPQRAAASAEEGLLKTICVLGAIALAGAILGVAAWQRNEETRTAYRVGQKTQELARLRNENRYLRGRVEAATTPRALQQAAVRN